MKHRMQRNLLGGVLSLGMMLAFNSQANPNPSKYAGYQADGRTSASVLSAKRSHSVSQNDELGLTIFSALIAIAGIAFAASVLRDSNKH